MIPGATYRLQLSQAFTFADAERIVPYLARLGITHVYLSPYLKARPGSSHGYDVIDHASINEEIGSRAELESLTATLHAAGMGQIADVVPNHMGVMGSDNAWWLDVLENGQASEYADYFDIDWQPVRSELRDKVLVPVLGDHYGKVLERGELKLEFDPASGALAIHYFEHSLPLDPASYGDVLGHQTATLGRMIGKDNPDYAEYLSILRAFEHLPAHRETDPARKAERQREKEVTKRRLGTLYERCAGVRQVIQDSIMRISGTPERPESFARLHELLERQVWRVAFWQVAADEINYRRFFDINDLAALRTENPALLKATHELIADLYARGVIDGLRIDHPDGLYNPTAYFAALQSLLSRSSADASPTPCYVVAEKILATHEYLREDWAVSGTTGYDFAFLTGALTVYAPAEAEIERGYRAFTHETLDFDELLYRCKKLIVRVYLSSELTTLANLLNQIAQLHWHTRDFTLNGIRDALTEIVACFPVYRTYVTPDAIGLDDRKYVDWAVSWARQRDSATAPDLYDFIRRQLLLDLPEHLPWQHRAQCERFAMKFQQYTAPVMAKALEDTCFYRYVRLASLCEVGGDPRRFGISVAAFHHQNRARQRRWPHAMLAGSTHDNKRSEDVRARLNVLSEMPQEWRERIRRWRRFTRRLRQQVDELEVPTRRDEYFFYQNLVGIWPLEPAGPAELEQLADRLVAYMLKAVREAKEQSSWMLPNLAYEAALERYIRLALTPGGDRRFHADVAEFAARIAPFGLLNSLSQTVLRLTAPGVPDLYQGNEIWDFSLVDPDNRRPVDYAARASRLDSLIANAQCTGAAGPATVQALMQQLGDGRAKLYAIWRLLGLRARHRALFDAGEYVPLTVGGSRSDHVCAFARHHADGWLVVIAGRWFQRLQTQNAEPRESSWLPTPELWGDTYVELPDPVPPLHDVLTGSTVDVADNRVSVATLLAPLPATVLSSAGIAD